MDLIICSKRRSECCRVRMAYKPIHGARLIFFSICCNGPSELVYNICVAWLIDLRMCGMTHWFKYVWHDSYCSTCCKGPFELSYIYLTWLLDLHISDLTHWFTYVWHDSFIHICVTHWCTFVWHDSSYSTCSKGPSEKSTARVAKRLATLFLRAALQWPLLHIFRVQFLKNKLYKKNRLATNLTMFNDCPLNGGHCCMSAG